MSEPKGPWDHDPPPAAPPPPRRDWRVWAFIGVVAAALAGVWGLTQLFPGAVSRREDWANVVYFLGLTAILAAGLMRARLNLGRSARHLGLWVGILLVLAIGYSFRGDLGIVWMRLRSEFAPGYAVQSGPREMVVTQDSQDNFVLIGQVNGVTVRFVVDTGATDIVLSPADARRLGLDVDHMAFPRQIETANGTGAAADFTAQSLAVGQIRFSDVRMSVNATPMSSSLLGVSFLKRLESFQMRDGRLYLKWRG